MKPYSKIKFAIATCVALWSATSVSFAADVHNSSVRVFLRHGERAIFGFVIPESSQRVVIRVVGPSLSLLGIHDGASDPKLSLYSSSNRIGTNDNWNLIDPRPDDPVGIMLWQMACVMNETASRLVWGQCGAFPLTSGSKDAAIIQMLQRGAYTVLAENQGDPGEVLIEVFQLPSP